MNEKPLDNYNRKSVEEYTMYKRFGPYIGQYFLSCFRYKAYSI